MKGAIELFGGGGTKLFAAIGVTYPAGSTLTCTNGTKTLTAKPKSEDNTEWVFAIPEAGTWTVTATDGTSGKTKSQSVSITKEGQFKSIELIYAYYVFKTGSGVANEWKLESGSAAFANVNTTRIQIGSTDRDGYANASAGSVAKYNTTPYAKLNFDIDCNHLGGGNFYVGISSKNTGSGFFAASKKLSVTGRQTVTVDISNCNDNYYVKAYQDCWPSSQLIYNIWFE